MFLSAKDTTLACSRPRLSLYYFIYRVSQWNPSHCHCDSDYFTG